jgi:hypothetical protein
MPNAWDIPKELSKEPIILEDTAPTLNVNFQCGHCGTQEWRVTVRWSDRSESPLAGGAVRVVWLCPLRQVCH